MAFSFLGLFSGKPSKDAFAKLVMRELAAATHKPIQYNEESFILTCGEQRVYLGNAYAYYCQAKSKEDRDRILTNLIAPFSDNVSEISLEDASPLIVAVVRERAMFSVGTLYWRLDGADLDESKIAFEPISNWYSKALVLDFPTHVRIVNKEDLERWNVSFEELFQIGLKRLAEATLPKFQAQDGYFVGTWKDDYDNSRVLLPSLFQDLPIRGEPVMVTPNRLTLMVADSANPSAVKAMLQRAEQIVQSEPRPQNPAPLCYRDGILTDYVVSLDSPVYQAVARAQKLTALNTYEDQQEQLHELYAQSGKDYFVASYKLIQREDGSYLSFSQWSKGISTLLPETDAVIFFDPERPEGQQTTGPVPWDKVCAELGDQMLDTEMFPSRFFVSTFPDPGALERMTAKP